MLTFRGIPITQTEVSGRSGNGILSVFASRVDFLQNVRWNKPIPTFTLEKRYKVFSSDVDKGEEYDILYHSRDIREPSSMNKALNFIRREQTEAKEVKESIIELYHLAKVCNLIYLRSETIHERIVEGIRDCTLSKKMEMDKEGQLEKATTIVARSYEGTSCYTLQIQ